MYFHRSVVILVLSFIGSVLSANILGIFTHGHRSHLLFYADVVKVLEQQGHNVTVVFTQPMEELPATCKQIQLTSPPPKVRDKATSRLQAALERIEQASTILESPEWQRLMHDDRSHYDLVMVGYLFNDYLFGVAAPFRCPLVVLWPGPPIAHIHSLVGNPEDRWYVTQPYDSQQRRGFRALLLGFYEYVVELMSFSVMERIYNQHFAGEEYPSFWSARANVSLVFCNHFSTVEGPIAPYVPSLIEIGGLQNYVRRPEHTTDISHEIQRDRRPVIYLSFGTRLKWSSLPANITTAFMNTFKQLPEFLVLWTYDGDCSDLTRGTTNIRCKSWWPQGEILSHRRVKLFITHGGKGSISEALYNGVPMLGMPFVGDQRPNIARLVEKGLAMQLTPLDFKQEDLLNCIEMLTDSNGSFAREAQTYSKLYRDRPMAPNATLAYWIDYVVRHRGAYHMRSPRLQLSVWQRISFGAYVCLGGIILVLLLMWKCCDLCLKSGKQKLA